MTKLVTEAWLYQQFDADFTRPVPAESYGGWRRYRVELPLERLALVSMHTVAFGTRAQFPGVYRAEEGAERQQQILREVFPPLLAAARGAGLPVIHLPCGGRYSANYPGFQQVQTAYGRGPAAPPGAVDDESVRALRQLRRERAFPGAGNLADCEGSGKVADFPPESRPVGDEPIVLNAHQLNGWCRDHGVNHLIYIGFNINWCLLMSAGGMLDLSRLGYVCSTVREAVTAVESRDSARHEEGKEEGLWRVAVEFGLVFDCAPLVAALRAVSRPA